MNVSSKVSLGLLSLALILGTSNTAISATAVNLGAANSFAVLSGSTITNTGSTVVNGDLGMAPGTSVTGFPPGTVNGTQHINNALANQAQTDLVTAYNSASDMSNPVVVSGDLGGRTLTPGTYSSASSMGLTGTLTLDAQGDPNAVFVFQVGSALTTASGSSVNLVNGAQACNVFWQVSSSATLGTNSNFAGSILALTSVTATTGASINGRLLARNGAVTLDTNSVSRPVCAAVIVAPPTPPVIAPPVTSIPPVVVAPISSAPAPAAPSAPVPVPSLPKTGFGSNVK